MDTTNDSPLFSSMGRRRALALGALGVASLPLLQGVALAQDVLSPSARVAAQVQSFYDRTRSLSAQFSQAYYHATYRRTDEAAGRFALDKPGRVRFDYDDGKVMVSNRSRIAIFEPGEDGAPGHYMERRAEEDATHEGFRFLMGTARIDEDYRYRLLDAARYRWSGYVLELRPRRESPSVRRVLLYVDARPGREGVVHRIRIDDHDRNRNTLTFRRMSFADARDDAFYNFRPPAGAVLDVR